MILGSILAFVSALLYGVSDYYGAVATKRFGLIAGTTLGYLFATLAAGIGLLIVGGYWTWPAIVWGSAAALCTIVGLLAFYRALVIGPVSLLSPLIALLESAVPVVFAAMIGERFGVLTWVAIALALLAGVLMSVTTGSDRTRLGLSTLGIALISGITLGASVVFLDQVPNKTGVVSAFVDISGGLIFLGLVLAFMRLRTRTIGRQLVAQSRRETGSALSRGEPFAEIPQQSERPREQDSAENLHNDPLHAPPAPSRISGTLGRSVVAPLLNGGFLGCTNVLLVLALQHGNLAVVGVLVSLYPLTTILLALIFDKESPSIPQWFGIGIALLASTLFGLT